MVEGKFAPVHPGEILLVEGQLEREVKVLAASSAVQVRS
jgi:hypothetical protein